MKRHTSVRFYLCLLAVAVTIVETIMVVAENTGCISNNVDKKQCTQCATGFNLTETGMCEVIAFQPYLCTTWDSSGKCRVCRNGYIAMNSFCVDRQLFEDLNPECSWHTYDKCKRCAEKQIYKDGVCTTVNDLCLQWDELSGLCTKCNQEYTLFGGLCLEMGSEPTHSHNQQSNQQQNGQMDFYCARIKDNKCIKCVPRSVNISGICTAVSDQCQAWDQQTAICTRCYTGYSLSSGKCKISITPQLTKQQISKQKNSLKIYENCSQVKNNECIKCASMTTKVNGVCTTISNLCKEWDTETALCTSCYIGYTKTSEGKCVIDF